MVTISHVTAAGVKLDKSMRFESKLGCRSSGSAAVVIRKADLDTANADTDRRPSQPMGARQSNAASNSKSVMAPPRSVRSR